jgi:hypothetical protein
MAIVVFVPADFKAAYPEFAATSDARCTVMFTMAAQAILDNTDNSPVMALDYRTQLFYLLVAHLLTLFAVAADGSERPVGRVDTATEGSVSVGFAYELPAGSAMAAWFNQTKYGALYWMMTAQFRSMKYFVAGDSGLGDARNFRAAPFNVPAGVITP